MASDSASVGLVGLGTMGSGLAQALARAGLRVEAFEPSGGARKGVPDSVEMHGNLQAMVGALSPPRRILMMVTAGAPVDSVIAALAPALGLPAAISGGVRAPFVILASEAVQLLSESPSSKLEAAPPPAAAELLSNNPSRAGFEITAEAPES